jgi:DnaJ-class molecular chaperone
VTQWEHPHYGNAGYWTSVCPTCQGKKFVLEYDFLAKESQPEPTQVAKKCSKCQGTGKVTKWENVPYGGEGYWTSACPKCHGKKFTVEYDFSDTEKPSSCTIS